MISGLIRLVLNLCSLALILYCVASFLFRDNPIYVKASIYMEKILSPIRNLLYRFFPKLQSLPVDLSPIVLFLILNILSRIFR